MYAGMGVMLATIWIHLGTDATKINDRLSVHFYSVAFLAFSKSIQLHTLSRSVKPSSMQCRWLVSLDVSAPKWR
jgi:hypothetical protein